MKTEEEHTPHHIDPLTGATHSHPVATGVGAASGGIAGMVAGAVMGPVGSLVGGAIGAAVGGAAGHAMGDEFDPYAEEEKHWRENYQHEPYHEKEYCFDDYGPAYRMGYEAHPLHAGKSYVEAEQELGQQWDKAKGKSRLTWEQAKHAVKAGWHKMEHAFVHRGVGK